jgi:hypothetical protein
LKTPLRGGGKIKHAAIFINIAATIFYRGRITAAVCGLPLQYVCTNLTPPQRHHHRGKAFYFFYKFSIFAQILHFFF